MVIGAVQQLVGLAAWRNVLLVVRFDPDIADALINTPLLGEIPRELLRHLPGAGVVHRRPWLGEGCGIFVSMDSAHERDGISTDDLDELIFTIVDGDQAALVTLLRLDQPTVAESVAASAAEAHAAALSIAQPEAVDAAARQRYGLTLTQLTSQLLSLVLYLASAQQFGPPDLYRYPDPRWHGPVDRQVQGDHHGETGPPDPAQIGRAHV